MFLGKVETAVGAGLTFGFGILGMSDTIWGLGFSPYQLLTPSAMVGIRVSFTGAPIVVLGKCHQGEPSPTEVTAVSFIRRTKI